MKLNLNYKENIKNNLINFMHIYKKKIIICSFLFFILFCSLFILNKNRTINIHISLNYKEASNGLNPNKSRFNIFDIKSDSVLERTLELAGVKNSYSVDDLSNDITIIQSNNQSTNIPTTYNIKYTKNLKITGVSSKQMAKFLVKAYKEYFKENYSNNNTILNYEIQDFSNDEYLSIIKTLDLNATKISDYLNDRLKENTTFKDKNNYTFEDLKESVDNVKNINIENLIAYVNENGLAKDTNSLKNLLVYKNELLDIDYKTNLIGYETRKEGISLYDSGMSAIVLIPSMDDNNDYYMSKTKIGIDYLAKDSNNYLSESEWFLSEITKNNDTINKLGSNINEDTKLKADYMIESIQETLKEISKNAISMDQEYIEYKNKNYISSSISVDHISIKKIVSLCFISIILSIFYNIINYIFKKIKNKRNIHEQDNI